MWGAEAAKHTQQHKSRAQKDCERRASRWAQGVAMLVGLLSLRHRSIVYLSTHVVVAFGVYLGNGELGIKSRIS